jgi:RNA polymerase sigma-70 factor (ECF subfamily)
MGPIEDTSMKLIAQGMSEETLVRNLLHYKPVLQGMIIALIGNASTAEDLFQEVALIMTRKRESVEEHCKFVAWGRSIALNVIRNWRKKTRRHKLHFLDEETLELVAREFEDTEDSSWNLRREALTACAGGLRGRDRELLKKRYEEDTSPERLAKSLGSSRGAIDSWLYRIRKALSRCVEDRLLRSRMAT